MTAIPSVGLHLGSSTIALTVQLECFDIVATIDNFVTTGIHTRSGATNDPFELKHVYMNNFLIVCDGTGDN